jgi:hypothetical protein
MKKGPEAAINLGRHAAECKICAHAQREEIEHDFVNWRSPASIAKHYKLTNRASVYRHAHALGLFPRRQRNVRAALERIIERAGEVEVNAAAVVSAVGAYARINAAGQWVERSPGPHQERLSESLRPCSTNASCNRQRCRVFLEEDRLRGSGEWQEH